jgi:hypothetical protein
LASWRLGERPLLFIFAANQLSPAWRPVHIVVTEKKPEPDASRQDARTPGKIKEKMGFGGTKGAYPLY